MTATPIDSWGMVVANLKRDISYTGWGFEFLRPAEQGKIECGKKHFEHLSAKQATK